MNATRSRLKQGLVDCFNHNDVLCLLVLLVCLFVCSFTFCHVIPGLFVFRFLVHVSFQLLHLYHYYSLFLLQHMDVPSWLRIRLYNTVNLEYTGKKVPGTRYFVIV